MRLRGLTRAGGLTVRERRSRPAEANLRFDDIDVFRADVQVTSRPQQDPGSPALTGLMASKSSNMAGIMGEVFTSVEENAPAPPIG